MTLLQEGLEVIRERGLVKRLLVCPDTGMVCSIGSMVVALSNTQLATSVRNKIVPCVDILGPIIREQFPDRVATLKPCLHYKDSWGVVVAFNNHLDTTQDEVEMIFEKAILQEQNAQM